MGRLVVVRHGQASIHAEDYDQLSPLGGTQAEALGQHWATMGSQWDSALVGPCRRHRQTADAVAGEYQKNGRNFPRYAQHQAFDEHQGVFVVKAEMTQDSSSGDQRIAPKDSLDDPQSLKAFMQRFRTITRAWVGGDLHYPQFENWQAFRERVVGGIQEILNRHQSGDQLVLFSSAGPLAVLTGYSLGLDDAAVLDLSWRVRNSAVAEFHFKGNQLFLESFNALPHLKDPQHLTLV